MPRRLPRFLATLALLLCACDASSSGDPGGGDGIALSDLCAAWGEAYCRAAVVCGTVDESQVSTCARVQASACDQERAGALVMAGRVAYDGAAYRRCLDHFAATPDCNFEGRPSLSRGDLDCQAAAVGRVPEAGSCGAADFGLLGLRECERGTCRDAGCDGYCVAVPQPGEECSGTCAPGYRCVDRICRPFGAEGEACSVGRDDCGVGLFCRASMEGGTGVCHRPLEVGTACDRFEDVCVAGATCPAPLGGHCTARATEGDLCWGTLSCGPGLFCPPVQSPFCMPQQPVGQPCDFQDGCLAPATCDAETGVCVQRPIIGEPCSSSPGSAEACATGRCDGTTCRRMILPGEACTHDFECAGPETRCVDGRCIPWGGCGG